MIYVTAIFEKKGKSLTFKRYQEHNLKRRIGSRQLYINILKTGSDLQFWDLSNDGFSFTWPRRDALRTVFGLWSVRCKKSEPPAVFNSDKAQGVQLYYSHY